MNQKDNSEEVKQTETLADLELPTEQDEQVKAGHSGGGAGKVSMQDFHFVMR